MSDACFSPASLALLATIGGILQAVIVTLFYGWVRSLEQRVKDAQAERDRAADNLERSLNIGETTVGLRQPRRQRS